jgi:FHS family L-fucose permease-like MFS transporter
LLSFFVIALGFCLQQTAANPFVILLGEERTGAHRLNLAGGVNSFGTTIGPLIVAYFLFGEISASSNAGAVKLENVDSLYLILIALFLGLAYLLRSIKLEEKLQVEKQNFSLSVLNYPQLVLGMIAIFVYVGVEVTIQSNLGALLNTPEYGNVPNNLIFPFISLYWGSLMMGRWSGASESLSDKPGIRKLFQALLPLLAFVLVYVVNYLKSSGVEGSSGRIIFALPGFCFIHGACFLFFN